MSTPRNNLDELRRQRGNGSRAQTPEPSTSSARVIDPVQKPASLALKLRPLRLPNLSPQSLFKRRRTSLVRYRCAGVALSHTSVQSGSNPAPYPLSARLVSAKMPKPLLRNLPPLHLQKPTPLLSRSHPTTMLPRDGPGCLSNACHPTPPMTPSLHRLQSVPSLTRTQRRRTNPSARVARARRGHSPPSLWSPHRLETLLYHRDGG